MRPLNVTSFLPLNVFTGAPLHHFTLDWQGLGALNFHKSYRRF